jgi:hypothetical protein
MLLKPVVLKINVPIDSFEFANIYNKQKGKPGE